jgi:hypothetical protein
VCDGLRPSLAHVHDDALFGEALNSCVDKRAQSWWLELSVLVAPDHRYPVCDAPSRCANSCFIAVARFEELVYSGA